jgi:hypothetical protein
MRYAAKSDGNAKAVVQMFRALGCTVEHVVPRRAGVPDLLVGCSGSTHLVEVKLLKGRLRPAQVEWAQEWRGERPCVVRTVDDVRVLVAGWRNVQRNLGVLEPDFDASDYERPVKR